MKKRMAVLLAVAMVVMMFGGMPAFAEKTEETPVIQVVLPSNVQDFPDGITEDNNFIVDYWREKTGYDFDCIVLNNENADVQLATMLNAGELNGIIVTRGAANVGKYAAEELILSLEDYKDKAAIYTMNDCSAGIYDGEQYAFCQSDSINYSTQQGLWYMNVDILNELGLDHTPATYDEFVDYLYAAKKAGYMPLAVYGDPARGDNGSTFTLLQGIYGLGGGEYGVNDNKEVYYKYISDEAKAYLEFCQKLYADGIIPSDFASQTADGVGELLLSKKAASGMGISVWTQGIMTQAEEMGITMRFADYPTDVNGNTSWGSMNIDYGATSLIFMIADGCDYVNECIDVMNLWCTDECITLANNGIQGTHWEYTDAGKIAPIEGSEDIAWGVYYRNVHNMDYWYDVYGINAKHMEFYYPSERPIVGCTNYDPVIHMAVDAERTQRLDELAENIVYPFYTKVIMGDESIDNWDKMVSQWKAEGGEELMKWYTEQYQALGCPISYYWSQLPEKHDEYTGKYLYGGAEAAATQLDVADNK